MNIQKQFNQAIKSNNIEDVKLLLNHSEVNPAYKDNWAIICAYYAKHTDIVNLLWQDQRIKDTLKNDDIDLYNELIKKDKIKEKVEVF